MTATLTRALDLMAGLIAHDTDSAKTNLPLMLDVEDYLRGHDVPFVISRNRAGDKQALLATIGPMAEGGVILSGHTDVVPVTGQSWTTDPFVLRRDGERLYGRGSCDMKGFCALALAMVPEFQAARLRHPVHILLSYDEETTCLGPVDILARIGRDLPRPRAAIVGEPTMMQVADSHKCISTYVTTVHGREAHSAKPALGVNAIEIACEIVGELYRIHARLALEGDSSGRFDPPQSTVHVGIVAGGTARNILARECRLQWEFRGLPGVAQNTALARLEEFAARAVVPRLAAFAPQSRVETVTEVEIPGLASEPGSAAETLALKLSQSNRTVAVAFATEAGRFQAAAIPAVVCGPGSIDQAHQPDEYIEIAQLEAGLAFLRRLAAELA